MFTLKGTTDHRIMYLMGNGIMIQRIFEETEN